MAVRQIRVLGDPVLRTPADPVTSLGGHARNLVRDLFDTLDVDEGRVGLAAPQIGVSMRVFVYDVHGVRGHVVNPELELSEEEQEGDEGCLSVPDLWFPTRRALRATATGTDMEGSPVKVSGTDELARCLQHETDHLDGMVYLDRLDRSRRREAMRALREAGW